MCMIVLHIKIMQIITKMYFDLCIDMSQQNARRACRCVYMLGCRHVCGHAYRVVSRHVCTDVCRYVTAGEEVDADMCMGDVYEHVHRPLCIHT